MSDSAMPHLAEGAGFEPTVTESKSVVLPTTLSLHVKEKISSSLDNKFLH